MENISGKNQISEKIFRAYDLKFDYNLIQSNKYTNKYLLEKDSLISYSMLLKKAKNKYELQENIEMITNYNKEKLKKIRNISKYLLEQFEEKEAKMEASKKEKLPKKKL